MKLETLAIHAGRHVDLVTGAVTPPIHLSTTFERDKDGGYARGFSYTRGNNPNRKMLEECLAKLEGGAAATAFASGTAAANGVFRALAPGDHVITPLYKSSGAITWSPGASARKTPFAAAVPDANAVAAAPPSSFARHSSSILRFGLLPRV